MTGAPKQRSVEILQSLEDQEKGDLFWSVWLLVRGRVAGIGPSLFAVASNTKKPWFLTEVKARKNG